MTIAVAQTVPCRGDVAANIEQHLRLIEAAAERRARVVVFPELSLTGYEIDLARDLAFTLDDARLAPLVEAAKSRSVIVVAGAPVKLGARLHIGAFILTATGGLRLYTKHHLGAFSAAAACDGIVPPAESTAFRPGRRNPLLRIDGATAALAVCSDTGRPSHAAAAAARGARIYLASMFVIPSEFDREIGNLAGIAARHAMTVAFANYGGPSGGLRSAGGSAIWAAGGEPLARLEREGVGLAVATRTNGGWRAEALMLGVMQG